MSTVRRAALLRERCAVPRSPFLDAPHRASRIAGYRGAATPHHYRVRAIPAVRVAIQRVARFHALPRAPSCERATNATGFVSVNVTLRAASAAPRCDAGASRQQATTRAQWNSMFDSACGLCCMRRRALCCPTRVSRARRVGANVRRVRVAKVLSAFFTEVTRTQIAAFELRCRALHGAAAVRQGALPSTQLPPSAEYDCFCARACLPRGSAHACRTRDPRVWRGAREHQQKVGRVGHRRR